MMSSTRDEGAAWIARKRACGRTNPALVVTSERRHDPAVTFHTRTARTQHVVRRVQRCHYARARCPQRRGRNDKGGRGQQDKGGREQQAGSGRSPRTAARRQRGATHRDLKRPEALAEDNQGIVRNELA